MKFQQFMLDLTQSIKQLEQYDTGLLPETSKMFQEIYHYADSSKLVNMDIFARLSATLSIFKQLSALPVFSTIKKPTSKVLPSVLFKQTPVQNIATLCENIIDKLSDQLEILNLQQGFNKLLTQGLAKPNTPSESMMMQCIMKLFSNECFSLRPLLSYNASDEPHVLIKKGHDLLAEDFTDILIHKKKRGNADIVGLSFMLSRDSFEALFAHSDTAHHPFDQLTDINKSEFQPVLELTYVASIFRPEARRILELDVINQLKRQMENTSIQQIAQVSVVKPSMIG